MPAEVAHDRFRLRNQFPFLRLFEAAERALSPASMTMTILATVVLGLAGWFVNLIVPLNSADIVELSVGEQRPPFFEAIPGMSSIAHKGLIRPWTDVIEPARSILVSVGHLNLKVNHGIQLALSLMVWSFVGLIVCRRTALIFAGDDESTLPNAIQYGLKRWFASLCAPLIPLAAAATIGLVVAMIGFIGGIPFVGSTWLLVFSPVLLLAGFCIAFLVVATTIGWPLMVAAVAVDDCDSFGGLSRAFSTVTGRPWQVMGYLFVCTVAGVILTIFVSVMAEMTVCCAMSVTSFGSGVDPVKHSLYGPIHRMAYEIVVGIGCSFFWSSAAVVYLLLRQDVDGVPLYRIAPDDNSRTEREPLPVVGMPATDVQSQANSSV